ncbi:MAG: DUF6512 family protein [Candidatus Bathyarchaeia archaeon]
MERPGMRAALRLEISGVFFIIILGSALHFTFELSGRNPIVGVFSAVNESVWEHLKLSFWPALTYAAIEYRLIRREAGNFLPAKTLGIYLMPLIIVSLFYLYTAFMEENLVLDILIFVIAVIIGQLASYKLLIRGEKSEIYARISVVALILLALLFVIFTFYPPHLPVFRDPVSGNYGITKYSVIAGFPASLEKFKDPWIL